MKEIVEEEDENKKEGLTNNEKIEINNLSSNIKTKIIVFIILIILILNNIFN